MQFRDYVRVGRRWLPIAFVVALAGSIAAYELTRYEMRPIYTATVVMQVQLGGSSTDPQNNSVYAQTLAAVANEGSAVGQADAAVAHSQPGAGGGEYIGPHEVSCTADGITALITCTVSAHHAIFAGLVANALAATFISNQQASAQTALQNLLKPITAQESQLLKQIVKINRRIQHLETTNPGDTNTIAALTSQASTYQTSYGNLAQQEMTARAAAAQAGSATRVVSPATTPTSPSSPHPSLNAIVAFVLLGSLVFGAGLVAERVDDRIRDVDEIKAVTGLPVLGIIPSIPGLRHRPLGPNSLVLDGSSPSAVADAFRVVRAGIGWSRLDHPTGVLLLTSPLPGDGTSLIAANLGAAFAESGKRVILVDLDLRRPGLATIFDVTGPGLTGLLLKERQSPERHLSPTREPNLMVMPTGPLPPNPAELIGSRHFEQTLERLRPLADVVIIDGPPLLTVADAAIAARLCDASVLVVRPDQAKRHSLRRAVDMLEAVGSPVLGVVVNGVTPGHDGYYDYRRAYYGHGQGPIGSNGQADEARYGGDPATGVVPSGEETSLS